MPGIGDRFRSTTQQLSSIAPEAIPHWLVTAGVSGWLVIGIAAVLALLGWFISYSASISIPLLLALVIGMVAYPLCESLTKRGLPKALAASVVLALLAALVVLVIWVTTTGILAQWPAIQSNVEKGTAAISEQLTSLGIDVDALRVELMHAAESSGDSTNSPLVTGLLKSVGSWVSAGLSGTLTFLFGVFIALTLLFYVLTDFPRISEWIAAHMGGLPLEVGQGIVEDAVRAMRGYFRGTTISGFVIASIIGIAMLVMGVPLAAAVALVTFLTCYIPFFGAIVSGAFAFLVALGSSGFTTALVLLAVVLVTQNVLQTVINARVMGDSLNLHPLVVLVVTMLGGIFGGLLGAALGAPLAALLVSAGKRLSAAFGPTSVAQASAAESSADLP